MDWWRTNASYFSLFLTSPLGSAPCLSESINYSITRVQNPEYSQQAPKGFEAGGHIESRVADGNAHGEY